MSVHRERTSKRYCTDLVPGGRGAQNSHFISQVWGNVNARGDRNRTPILTGLENMKLEVASVLLAHGANLNFQDDWDDTPLHLAAVSGELETMSLLVAQGADVNA